MILLQICGFILLAASGLAVDCPEGYLPHDNACYAFIMHTATWAEAREYCLTLKSHLARIETAKEQNYILGQTSRLGGDFWIAGFDYLEEGTWYWDGLTPIGQTWWYSGQPGGGVSNNCLALMGRYSHAWFATPCYNYYHFVCERTAGLEG
ncbi:perlucin-like [Gigantopelta aegis]|uniref:perlucin-like n=1 Tax=Gigantopelta aegis TaxID=1735272 RepID=UPI001B8887ED|nr:perlucin-like [Gigantopelta aegis]